MSQDSRLIFDWSALGITAGALMEWLPSLSAALSALWFGLRCYQTLKELRDGRSKDK